MSARNSRILTVVTAVAVSFAGASIARAQEPAPSVSGWQKFSWVVKTKVKEWWDYFNGRPGGSTAAQAVKPTPAESQSSAPPPAPPASVGTGTTPVKIAPPAVPGSPNPTSTSGPQKAAARPGPSEEIKSLRAQKLFTNENGESLSRLRARRDQLKAASVLKIAKPARQGTSRLQKNKLGVPVADFGKVRTTKVVPALDIGRDVTISREDFGTGDLGVAVGKPADFKRLPSPPPVSPSMIAKALSQKAQAAPKAKNLIANMRTVGKPVNHDTIASVQYNIQVAEEARPLPYKPLSEEHLKMVAALILFEKGNHCHMIMGLFHQLAKTDATRVEANYHLGACAASLNMKQVAFDRLAQVVRSEDREFGTPALDLMAKDLPLIYEEPFYRLLKSVKSFKNLVSEASQDAVAYRMAKGAYRARDFKTSADYAARVSRDSEYHDHARFLAAMNSFALKDKTGALKKLEELWGSLEARKVQDRNIRALTSVNLGRMYFAQKQYAKSLEHYMQVPKDHALWVQALIEQGWTQLALEDHSGAIGNMYSLHSPYFRAVYQPESFVVRTIGYLNICQYGDAYRTLTQLETEYRATQQKLATYLQNKSEPLSIYDTVKTYIRGKSGESVEGVPYQVWREVARRKDYLNLQTALNDKQDEPRQYEGINEKIKAEKAGIRWHAEQSKKRFDTWKGQLAKARADKGLNRHRDEWEANLKRERDLTVAYRFKLAILEQSRQGFLDFQSLAQKRLNEESSELNQRAGQTLIRHAKSVRDDLARVLDNNEFLRYEVFSGSGENIRYQVAGGNVGSEHRIPAHIKPTKSMNWNFDGEFWEDEIGSYRSSLQNVCPTAMTTTAKTVSDDEEE